MKFNYKFVSVSKSSPGVVEWHSFAFCFYGFVSPHVVTAKIRKMKA